MLARAPSAGDFHKLPGGAKMATNFLESNLAKTSSTALAIFVNLDSVFHFREFTLKKEPGLQPTLPWASCRALFILERKWESTKW